MMVEEDIISTGGWACIMTTCTAGRCEMGGGSVTGSEGIRLIVEMDDNDNDYVECRSSRLAFPSAVCLKAIR